MKVMVLKITAGFSPIHLSQLVVMLIDSYRSVIVIRQIGDEYVWVGLEKNVSRGFTGIFTIYSQAYPKIGDSK